MFRGSRPSVPMGFTAEMGVGAGWRVFRLEQPVPPSRLTDGDATFAAAWFARFAPPSPSLGAVREASRDRAAAAGRPLQQALRAEDLHGGDGDAPAALLRAGEVSAVKRCPGVGWSHDSPGSSRPLLVSGECVVAVARLVVRQHRATDRCLVPLLAFLACFPRLLSLLAFPACVPSLLSLLTFLAFPA